MAEPLKNLYNQTFFKRLIGACDSIDANFKSEEFIKNIYDEQWEERELKERLRHITLTLKQYIKGSFPDQLDFLLKMIPAVLDLGVQKDNLEFTIIPDFVEVFGMNHPEISIAAFETITQFVTCEFAVRPFIIQYESMMLPALSAWSLSHNVDVRRLSSEGCRPRLPWAMALPKYKKDPSPILPILENLKNDASEYVRRSVANNLNDISKDHPQKVFSIAKRWKGKTVETDKLVKHACRSLLKQGVPEVMQLFGFGAIDQIQIEKFELEQTHIKVGGRLTFSFELTNTSKEDQLLRLEYAVYYQKANGSLSKKVYKISEKKYAGLSTTGILRNQSFKPISTRVFHPGLHQIALVINGIEQEKYDFFLAI